MSWRKVKLGDLCTIEKGKTGIQKAIPGEFPLVVTAEERKSHNEYQFDTEAVIIPLVSGTGHGHASIKRLHFQTGKFALGTILCAVIPKERNILNTEYLFRFLTLNKDRELVDRMKGMANVTLPMKEIANIEIPLPSLENQIKFVEKYKLLEIHSENISEELTNQLHLIKELRQKFLLEAIQGKLITYVNIQETGQKLLEKIKNHKLQFTSYKKNKLQIITKEEIPYTIPKHWIWCRLGEIIINIIGGGTPSKANPEFWKGNIPWASVKDLNVKYLTDTIDKITEASIKSSSTNLIPKNNIIVCTRMGLGKIVINKVDIAINQDLKALILSQFINQEFFYNYYRTLEISGKGMTVNGIRQDELLNFPFPLPPLKEQEKIVEKIDKLMEYCDGLEQSIIESQNYNTMLLKQVLRESLQPIEIKKTIYIENRKIENPLKTILAGHIINLNNTTDFGRVKFQKLLFLTEYICKIDFDSNYIKKVAGPYDDALIKNIEADFNRMRFFNVVQDKTDNKRVRYTALAGANELENLFLENFPNESIRINNTLLKFRPLSWGECELIATLYAVWNNRVIKNEPIADELLYSDFMAWDKQKSKYHSVFHKWLFWMKDERIIPDGWGKYIDRPQ